MSHTRVVIVVSCKIATYKAAWEQGQLLVRADGCNLPTKQPGNKASYWYELMGAICQFIK